MYTDFQKKWIKDNCSKTSLSKLMISFLGWIVAIVLIVLHVYKFNNDITSKTFLNIFDYLSYFYVIISIITCLYIIPTCLMVVFVLQKIIDDNDNEQYFIYIKSYKNASFNLQYEKILKFIAYTLSFFVAISFVLNGYVFCSLVVSTCLLVIYFSVKIMLKAHDNVFAKVDEDFIEKYEEWIDSNE